MRTEAGGRLLLRLVKVSDVAAEYATTLSTSRNEWFGVSRVALTDGAVEFTAEAGPAEAPAWLVEATRTALRVAWRAAQQPGGAFPKRIQRWRPAPGDSGQE